MESGEWRVESEILREREFIPLEICLQRKRAKWIWEIQVKGDRARFTRFGIFFFS